MFFSRTVATSPPLSSHLVSAGRKYAGNLTELNDSTVREVINKGFFTGWHVVGSCAMMPRDRGGVVDSKLKVYGVRRLRVVDASIVPLHVRGNTMSLVYALAERAADLIKAERNGTVGGGAGGGGRIGAVGEAFTGQSPQTNPQSWLTTAGLALLLAGGLML